MDKFKVGDRVKDKTFGYGTIVESNMLEEKKNNYIKAIYKEGMYFGLAVCDISTGDFYATEIKEENNFSKLIDESFKSSELGFPEILKLVVAIGQPEYSINFLAI